MKNHKSGGGVLGDGAELLMTEQEYEDTLKQGQGPTQQKNVKEQHKECVKVSVRERTPNKSFSERATKGLSTLHPRKLQDRPIPQQQYEWYHNPQMPRKWNEMVAAMQDHEANNIENVFRIAEPEEISKPQRFKHLYRDSKWVERTCYTAVASSIIGRDDTDDRLHAMRDKCEKQLKVSQISTKEKIP